MSELVWNALEFAAQKHRDQCRKDVHRSPYINHPIAVARILAVDGGVTDVELLVAAILHDTIEDTHTSAHEIANLFGNAVLKLVQEVTDNKLLPRAERKQLQIEHAAHSSDRAKQLKIGDKIANLRDIDINSPVDWSLERKQKYIDWSQRVVAGCKGINVNLDELFERTVVEVNARVG